QAGRRPAARLDPVFSGGNPAAHHRVTVPLVNSYEIVSGAGHDAVYLAGITPAAMIFIPCKDGLSHNELESISVDHAEAGCNVLLKTVISLAGGNS
ncbi:M20/M25/M40 family metallo-hydrolase, partial [Acidithiobacillus ferrianus]|uniref:M20/M25/M40 family metallo-hydrolase n=1 Tax=Acidithiobacillus ferrianus TaxID=2678518 RepID=UPI0034E3E8CC